MYAFLRTGVLLSYGANLIEEYKSTRSEREQAEEFYPKYEE
jgi:hypothetical protein